jgi:hypothetical protein
MGGEDEQLVRQLSQCPTERGQARLGDQVHRKTADHDRMLSPLQRASGNVLKRVSLARSASAGFVGGERVRIDRVDSVGGGGKRNLSGARRQIEHMGPVDRPVPGDLVDQLSDDRFVRVAIVVTVLAVVSFGTTSDVGVVDGREFVGWFHRFISTCT